MSDRRRILVTGATDGLGQALAHRLASGGATVILHGRDAERLDTTADDIRDIHSVKRPPVLRADFASLAGVRRLAAGVRDTTDRLDVLVSNAGIGSGMPDGRERRTSADGYELRFAVNYLAGFLLTLELLPLLRRSPGARIINVASLAQHPLDFDDLMIEHGYTGGRAYGQSKLAQIMSGFELAARIPAGEPTVNSLHPATYMPTKMVLQEIGRSVDGLEDGLVSTARLVNDPELDGVTGRFFDRDHETRADDQAYDAGARAELWNRSLELTGAAGIAP